MFKLGGPPGAGKAIVPKVKGAMGMRNQGMNPYSTLKVADGGTVHSGKVSSDRGHWIQGAIKHPGREKRAAAKAGMSTHAYMEKHKHDSGSGGSAARLGLALSKMNKK